MERESGSVSAGRDEFDRFLQAREERTGGSAYVATDEDGKQIGFFGYTIDFQANEGVFKCVAVNPEYRGKGVGREMMRLAVKFAFEITNVDAVRLYVYTTNLPARKCYESIGFTETGYAKDALNYQSESWDLCYMMLQKDR